MTRITTNATTNKIKPTIAYIDLLVELMSLSAIIISLSALRALSLASTMFLSTSSIK